MTDDRILFGSVSRPVKLGTCLASTAPARLIEDLTQHEGLHTRRRDCFSWTWKQMVTIQQSGGLALRQQDAIDAESWEETTQSKALES